MKAILAVFYANSITTHFAPVQLFSSFLYCSSYNVFPTFYTPLHIALI